jgi:hypothetical protein
MMTRVKSERPLARRQGTVRGTRPLDRDGCSNFGVQTPGGERGGGFQVDNKNSHSV